MKIWMNKNHFNRNLLGLYRFCSKMCMSFLKLWRKEIVRINAIKLKKKKLKIWCRIFLKNRICREFMEDSRKKWLNIRIMWCYFKIITIKLKTLLSRFQKINYLGRMMSLTCWEYSNCKVKMNEFLKRIWTLFSK